jgi:tetratricopeptide (TPR) repeat protein
MRTQSCEATRRRGEQSEAVLELRTTCLDLRRRELKSTVQLLTVADEAQQRNAARAAGSLTSLAGCADVAALTAPIAPADPSSRVRVKEVRGRIADVRAMRATGKYADAVARAAALVEEARSTRYAPLIGEALDLLGDIQIVTDSIEDAKKNLREAVLAGEVGHDLRRAAHAWDLLGLCQLAQGKGEEAQESIGHAAAIVQGLGGDPELTATILDHRGGLMLMQGRNAEAEAAFREAIAAYRSFAGQDDFRVARTLANTGVARSRLNDMAGALELQQQANAMYLRMLGDGHPLVVQGQINIASSLQSLDRLDEAARTAQKALEGAEAGGQALNVAQAQWVMADIAVLRQQPEEAVRLASTARERIEKLRGPGSWECAGASETLGHALAALGRLTEAKAAYQRALDASVKLGDGVMRARVQVSLSDVSLRSGDVAAAQAQAESALARFESDSDPLNKADAQLALAGALARSDAARARSVLSAAVAVFRAAGPVAKRRLADADKLTKSLASMTGGARQ